MDEHDRSNNGTGKAELDPATLELRWEQTAEGGVRSLPITGIGSYVLTPSDGLAGRFTLELFSWLRTDGVSKLETGLTMDQGKGMARADAREKLLRIIQSLSEPIPQPNPDTFELHWNRSGPELKDRASDPVPGVGRYEVVPVAGTIEGFRLTWFLLPFNVATPVCLSEREDVAIAMERAKRHAREKLRQNPRAVVSIGQPGIAETLRRAATGGEFPIGARILEMERGVREGTPAQDCQDERLPDLELIWTEKGPMLVSNTLPGVGHYTIGPVQPTGRGPTAYDPVLRSLARHATRGESELLADRVSLKSAKTLATMHAICELARQRGRPAHIPEASKLAPGALKFGAELSASMKLALKGGKTEPPPFDMGWHPRTDSGFESRKIEDVGVYSVILRGTMWAVYRDPGEADTELLTERMPSVEAGKEWATTDAYARARKAARARGEDFAARAADLERQAADITAGARASGINVERAAELSRRALEKARQTLGYVEHPTIDTIRRFREALEKTEAGMIQTSVIIAWLDLLSDNLETHEMLRRKAGK